MNRSELVFLGDSLTMRHNWSIFKAANMGIDGDTTAGVLSRMHLVAQAKSIVLMIGVNDILNRNHITKIQKNYAQILENISQDQNLYILSLLPVIDDKQTKKINQDIRTMNRWLQNEVKKYNFTYINLYPLFLDTQKQGIKKSFTTDGIHLTQKAYELWKKTLKNEIKLD